MAHGYASRSFALGGTTTATDPEPWVRPADWLSLGAPQTTTEQIKLLVAVFPGDMSFMRIIAQGAFRVDWGDGAGPINYASNANAEKQFLWAQHAGTDTTRGYRQAVVTVTAQTPGSLTYFSTHSAHTVFTGMSPTVPVLDIEGYAPNLLTFQTTSISGGPRARMLERVNLAGPTQVTSLSYAFQGCSRLRQFSMDTSKSTSFASTFHTCYSLTAGPNIDTSAGTDFSGMFLSCSAMQTVPLYDTSKGTNFSTMFQNCYALRSVPLFDLSLAITCNSMFYGCLQLTSIPNFNLGNCTNLSSFIRDCSSLATIPAWNTSKNTTLNNFASNCWNLTAVLALDTSKVTDWTQAFSGCRRLTTIPALDASAATSMNNAFAGCTSLVTGPTLTTPNVTDMAAMFSGCSALTSVPLYDTSKVTQMQSMFANCMNLQTVPAFNTAVLVRCDAMFSGCTVLTTVPAFNWSLISSSANLNNVFANTGNITSIAVTGCRFGFSVANNVLSAAALDTLYTNLGTAAGSQTITVSGNPGTTGDTPTIATAKGWTVSGS